MFTESRFKTNFFLIQKKVLRSRSLYFLSLVPLLAVLYVFLADSLTTAIQFFLFLFPYLFLFISSDMMKDEIESGVLENIIFLRGEYRRYLFQKNLILLIFALLLSTSIFSALIIAGLLKGIFTWLYLLQFLAGIVVGVYYIALSGWLSFYFRGGSNVMIIIIAQVMAILSLFFSLQERAGFLDYLEKGRFPDLMAQLKFLVFALAFPNVLTFKKFLTYFIIVAVAASLFLLLQWLRIKNLELKKQ
ncbi:MAG: hypothetical protein H5U06_03910 [Candidatus Aminicenantes bacterium]|nr:hypothetical protein [Candidatus Aminicenantes bacterium]